MSSVCYGGSIRMKPEAEMLDLDPMFEGGYPHQVPKVYLEGLGEVYCPQNCFDWDDDSVIVVRDRYVVKYTRSSFVELLAKNEAGEIVWMDGRRAPYSDCWDGEYLNEYRGGREYTMEEYDLETSKRRKYKMLLEEESELDAGDYRSLSNFVDAAVLGSHMKIEDGVLLSYFGKDTDLIIPDGVCEVGRCVFDDSREFESISIPNTLVKLPSTLFGCCKVKELNISKDHPKYYVKDGCLIDKESGTVVWGYASHIIPIDERIHGIGEQAFINREDIKNIEVPNNITEIGDSAFANCTNLKTVTVSNPTCTIGAGCFAGCNSLVSVKLPMSLNKIENRTFSFCVNLESIEIPKTVNEIDDFAFNRCDGLKKVRVEPSLVEFIENDLEYKLEKEEDDYSVDRTIKIPVKKRFNFENFFF